MSNAIVIFTFEGVNVKVHCSTDDLMKDICQKFANKIERNVNSLIFLYGGSNLNFQLSFKELANIIDKERNEMNVLVYKNLNEFACPKCGEKINLNNEKINDIKSSIQKINDAVKDAKLMIESTIKISSEDAVKVLLKNINMLFNNMNEDIKKINQKVDGLLNVHDINNEINIDNYIIAEFNVKDEDVNKDIKILGSYEEFLRTNPSKAIEDNKYKNEEEIKKCKIEINDELIPFNYYHKFQSKGKYTIKYSFKNNLKNACLMFGDCKLLVNINLSNFNTNNVTNMNGMFYGCSSLTNINLSNFNTNNVTNMFGMFGECLSLNKNNIIIKDKRILDKKYLFKKAEIISKKI